MADPVTAGLGIMAVGGGISAIAGYNSDMAQAEAERKNAAFYLKQAEYAQAATDRQADIFQHDTEDLLARQVSAYARAGVDLAGSPMLLINQTETRARAQLNAIKEKGRQDIEVALMRAQSAGQAADDIEAGAPLKMIGSLFGTGGQMLSRAPAGKVSTTTTTSPAFRDTGAGTAVRTSGNIPYANPSWSMD